MYIPIMGGAKRKPAETNGRTRILHGFLFSYLASIVYPQSHIDGFLLSELGFRSGWVVSDIETPSNSVSVPKRHDRYMCAGGRVLSRLGVYRVAPASAFIVELAK